MSNKECTENGLDIGRKQKYYLGGEEIIIVALK